MWTDISVGGLYGALKRMHAEGLIADVRTEQAGNFPARQVYAITDLGRGALTTLRRDGLSEFTLRPEVINARVAMLRELLETTVTSTRRARPYLSLAEVFALEHREQRLLAEIDWHEKLREALPDIVADETARTHLPPHQPPPHSKDCSQQ